MSIGVATFLSPSKTTNAIPVQQDNGYKSSSSNEISNNTSEHKNFIEEESESKDANQEEQQQFNMKEILKQSVDLKLGKDTKFNLSEGTFWESPDGTGKSGTYPSTRPAGFTGKDGFTDLPRPGLRVG